MNVQFLKPFRKELKDISYFLNKENQPYKYFTNNFVFRSNHQLFPSQSFNFWKVVLQSHDYFRKFKSKRRMCIAILDQCDSHIDINECLIFFTYFYPKMGINLISIPTFFEIELFVKRRSHNDVCQFEAQSMCRALRKYKPNNCIGIIGITENELYFDDSTFVLGQSFFPMASSVICLGKQGEIVPANRAMLTERLIKCVIHETGHLFGLHHCTMFSCLMNESKSIAEAANQPFDFCPICLSKLQYLLAFNVRLRYDCLSIHVSSIVTCDASSGIGEYGEFLAAMLTSCSVVNV